jgi:murein DD-endopeptidase MepM/ murein hydrolase activator NlpD
MIQNEKNDAPKGLNIQRLAEFLKKYSWTVIVGVAVLGAVLLGVAYCVETRGVEEPAIEPEPLTMYDIPYERYSLVEGEVENGQTMGKIFERFGVGPAGTFRAEQAAQGIFDLRTIRVGNRYVAFMEADTLSTDTIARPRLAHFVYEKSQTDYAVISIGANDSVTVRNGSKPVRVERRHAEAEIESSMWTAIAKSDMPIELAVELEQRIFGWSVDFFGLQRGDRLEVIYDQHYVDTVAVNGIGQVWGAVFHHGGKEIYAIPFKQEGKIAFWDENGNSLKKQFLRAPLSFTRITSNFSMARRHPITRRVRPHYGVDYGAPTGTPVMAVADGTVTRRYWDTSGGGNTLWLRHARGYETGYLHLSRFANIAVGSRVSQGQVIGYVGSTGGSTGPHLDYRIRVNGKYINPLSIPQEPGPPIAKADREAFAVVRAKVLAELAGTLPVEERLTQLDSITIPDTPLPSVNPSPVDTTKNIIDGGR